MAPQKDDSYLRLALPKGHMQEGVFGLLAGAGIQVRLGRRDYRPKISLPDYETKILKPQNIVEMLHIGSRDLGFAGADWVAEMDAQVVEVLDTGLDPVKVVAAAPVQILEDGRLPARPLVVASEYQQLSAKWIKNKKLDATLLRSYGATEVFPPEDADCIVDNIATGSTIRANGLKVVDELMASSTRLYANPAVLKNPMKREMVDRFVLLIRSVMESRKRVMVEVNVDEVHLEAVVEVMPCMREPTISALYGGAGYAVKSAVPRDELPRVIPEIKARGGTDIVVTALAQIVP